MMMDMERRYRQLQRATVARSALDVIAMIFLLAGFAFWGVAFWQLLAPPAILSLLTIQACVLALAFSLAAPLLLSMLVPTTPAGQLLQKTQWATVGFVVIVAAAGYLTIESERLIETWLSYQKGIHEGRIERELALVLTIAFVVIPALAWVQLTPERWLQQIQQAHQVKKLEIEQKGELAILKARLLWAKQKTAAGYANLLPAEREDVLQVIRGLFMSIGDSQRDIARTLGISAELERDMLGDDAIADRLDYVKTLLDAGEVSAPDPRSAPAADRLDYIAESLPPHQDAGPASPHPRPAPAALPSPQRPAAPRSAPQRYAVEYQAARNAFGSGLFTNGALAEALDMKDRTARDRLNAWLASGHACESETRGHFYLTDREAR